MRGRGTGGKGRRERRVVFAGKGEVKAGLRDPCCAVCRRAVHRERECSLSRPSRRRDAVDWRFPARRSRGRFLRVPGTPPHCLASTAGTSESAAQNRPTSLPLLAPHRFSALSLHPLSTMPILPASASLAWKAGAVLSAPSLLRSSLLPPPGCLRVADLELPSGATHAASSGIMAGAFGAHALAPRLGEKAATWVSCQRGWLSRAVGHRGGARWGARSL